MQSVLSNTISLMSILILFFLLLLGLVLKILNQICMNFSCLKLDACHTVIETAVCQVVSWSQV